MAYVNRKIELLNKWMLQKSLTVKIFFLNIYSIQITQ